MPLLNNWEALLRQMAICVFGLLSITSLILSVYYLFWGMKKELLMCAQGTLLSYILCREFKSYRDEDSR